MTSQEILDAIQHCPGAMQVLILESQLEPLKLYRGYNVIKRSRLYVSAGKEFANLDEVKKAIELGERGQVQPLSWGHWVLYPYIKGHTPKKTGQYTEYVRSYPPTVEQLKHFPFFPKVKFFCNGNPILREHAIILCGAEAKEKPQSNCLDLNCNGVLAIGDEAKSDHWFQPFPFSQLPQ